MALNVRPHCLDHSWNRVSVGDDGRSALAESWSSVRTLLAAIADYLGRHQADRVPAGTARRRAPAWHRRGWSFPGDFHRLGRADYHAGEPGELACPRRRT